MSRGTVALIVGLFVISLLFIFIVSFLVVLSGTLREHAITSAFDLPELMWRSLLRTLDPGTMGGDVGSVPFVVAMLTVTLGGIFIVATLIGIISTGLQDKLDELRKGRSRVLENNHTVILGWSAQIFEIIGEIVLANANKRGQCIVVLADRDKIEMEDAIKLRVPGHEHDAHRVPQRQPDRAGRPGHRQPADVTLDHRRRARDRRSRQRRDQDAAGDHQRSRPTRDRRTRSWPRSTTRGTSRSRAWPAGERLRSCSAAS